MALPPSAARCVVPVRCGACTCNVVRLNSLPAQGSARAVACGLIGRRFAGRAVRRVVGQVGRTDATSAPSTSGAADWAAAAAGHAMRCNAIGSARLGSARLGSARTWPFESHWSAAALEPPKSGAAPTDPQACLAEPLSITKHRLAPDFPECPSPRESPAASPSSVEVFPATARSPPCRTDGVRSAVGGGFCSIGVGCRCSAWQGRRTHRSTRPQSRPLRMKVGPPLA